MFSMLRLATLVASAGLCLAGSVRAQSFVYVGPRTVGPNVVVLPQRGYAIASYGTPRVISGGTYYPMYGYPSAPYPMPARLYSGYGSNDFAFHGQPYGHAWEPWGWEALSRYPANPPLRVTGVVLPEGLFSLRFDPANPPCSIAAWRLCLTSLKHGNCESRRVARCPITPDTGTMLA